MFEKKANGTQSVTERAVINVERIIRNACFSMEVEGFSIPPEQKTDLRRVLTGEMNANALRMSYIAKARRYGDASHINK